VSNTGIGRPVPRLEDARLLTGRGCFSEDFNLPDQAWAVLVRSPHAHARIAVLAVADAGAIPGVLAVLTGADYLADGLGPLRHSPAARTPPDIRLENLDGVPPAVSHQFPLAIDRVRFVGEGVALVVAETLAAARDAAKGVDVDYTPLAAVVGSAMSAENGAPLLSDEIASNVVLDAQVGNEATAATGFARAEHIVRRLA
jgi:carbon-monoxide dehydrogenase large subunit